MIPILFHAEQENEIPIVASHLVVEWNGMEGTDDDDDENDDDDNIDYQLRDLMMLLFLQLSPGSRDRWNGMEWNGLWGIVVVVVAVVVAVHTNCSPHHHASPN